jgi:DNA-binding transcriptional LysR family regulator
MEMQQIRYFLALSETLNFTKAAERCNVTQPTLTRAIRFLEGELGGELLRRERASSHLTGLGERLLPMMRQSYESALAAKTIAQSMRRGEIALLPVAVSHSVAIALLTPALLELSRLFPRLEINLRRGSGPEVAECLKSGEIELAIAGPLGEAWSRLDAFPLFEEPLDLFVSRKHRLFGRNLVEFKDLASETLLINAQSEMADQISDRLRAKGVVDTRVHRVATQGDLLTLLEANLGIAVIPVGAARSDGLSRVPLMEFDLARTVTVYSVAGRRRGAACAALLKMLRASDWGGETVTGRKSEVHR